MSNHTDTAARTDLSISCDTCHHVALYIAVPDNADALTTYSCAHHAYPLSAFAHLPR